MSPSNHRSAISLYSGPDCPFSHRTRFLLHEKQIDVQIHDIIDGQWPEAVAGLHPYAETPALVDHEVFLFNSTIIMEYLEDRFPHPSLMPAEPAARAQLKLMLYRIERDWYRLWPILNGSNKAQASKARKQFQEDLIVLSPLFDSQPYFMSDEISMLDCSLAPLLWRLPMLNIKLPDKARAVELYAQRLFARDSFQRSLSRSEAQMR